MTTFIAGFLGAIAAAGLLALGGALGWAAHAAVTAQTRPQTPPPGEGERRRLREEQQAFAMLQNYSPERAYGMLREEGMTHA